MRYHPQPPTALTMLPSNDSSANHYFIPVSVCNIQLPDIARCVVTKSLVLLIRHSGQFLPAEISLFSHRVGLSSQSLRCTRPLSPTTFVGLRLSVEIFLLPCERQLLLSFLLFSLLETLLYGVPFSWYIPLVYKGLKKKNPQWNFSHGSPSLDYVWHIYPVLFGNYFGTTVFCGISTQITIKCISCTHFMIVLVDPADFHPRFHMCMVHIYLQRRTFSAVIYFTADCHTYMYGIYLFYDY